MWWSLNCRASPAASRPAQPLSCEIQPFTCVLNRFLDKHLQASSCKYIRMSIIFSTWATTFNFLPWELWSTSQKICRKKRHETNQMAPSVLCLQQHKYTCYWELNIDQIFWFTSPSGGCKLYPEHYFHQYFTNMNVSGVIVSNLCSPANSENRIRSIDLPYKNKQLL